MAPPPLKSGAGMPAPPQPTGEPGRPPLLAPVVAPPVGTGVPAAMTKSTHTGGESSDPSADKRKRSTCGKQEDEDIGANCYSRNGISSWDSLSEDVVRHIHALMPMRDAARAACVSRSFRRSWRHYPNLMFSMEKLGLIEKNGTEDERALLNITDTILRNHSGTGVRTLELQLPLTWKTLDTCYVNKFLETAIAPGIQELTVTLPWYSCCKTEYNFPCSLLSGESGESIRHFTLFNSSFRPTAGLGCLTRLHLRRVRIGDDELGCFLSNSLALRHLQLSDCGEIICLKIPCLLQHLTSLDVSECRMLRSIESNAPNISTVDLTVDNLVDVPLSLGDGSSQVKKLQISCAFASYVLSKLPSIAPGLEALNISLLPHEVSTQMVLSKFHHLKFLNISLCMASEAYDYLCLLDFLDASPVLETFILRPARSNKSSDMINGDLTRMPEFRHDSLNNVTIRNFCSAGTLIELTRHMLQHVASLERITLDTTHGSFRCSSSISGQCFSMDTFAVREAQEALVAIGKFIKPHVPSNVELTVVGPCHVPDD
ncbi:unnamed protein product [Alopecurus aequalis]